MALDSNPVVQILGQEYDAGNVQGVSLNDAVQFFFTVVVASSVTNSKNWVHSIALTFLRAYGSMFCLSLLLGTMPDASYKNMDACVKMCVAALVFVRFVSGYIPAEVSKYTNYLNDLSYSIVKGNAAGVGYGVAASALGGNQFAGFMGAYVAVQGHRLLEEAGLKSMNKATFDNDDLLAVLGGPVFFLATTQGGASGLVARAVLVLFHISCNYVDYNGALSSVRKQVNSVAGGSKSKRGRSSSPRR